MKIPDELTRVLRVAAADDAVAYLATASRDGRPNLHVQPFTDVLDDEFVLMPDLFAQKTKVNLNENLVGALSIASPRGASEWVVEGPCNIFQWGHPDAYCWEGLRAGDVLARWGSWVELESLAELPTDARPSVVAQRGVIALHAAAIHYRGGRR